MPDASLERWSSSLTPSDPSGTYVIRNPCLRYGPLISMGEPGRTQQRTHMCLQLPSEFRVAYRRYFAFVPYWFKSDPHNHLCRRARTFMGSKL
jgi:hypothetical protein